MVISNYCSRWGLILHGLLKVNSNEMQVNFPNILLEKFCLKMPLAIYRRKHFSTIVSHLILRGQIDAGDEWSIAILPCIGDDVTLTSWWARWRLKSPALRLYALPLVQVQIKENIKAVRLLPLWGEFTGDRWIPRTKGQQRGKSFHLMTSHNVFRLCNCVCGVCQRTCLALFEISVRCGSLFMILLVLSKSLYGQLNLVSCRHEYQYFVHNKNTSTQYQYITSG